MVVTPYIISTPACTTTQVAGITTVIITSTVHAATSQSTTLRINTLPTVTVTSTVSATPSQCITILISPSPAQCYNQQVTDDGRNSCNAVAICVPVAMVIAVVVCVIVIFVVWRLRQKVAYNVGTNNLEMVYNDLYGLVTLYASVHLAS